MAAAEATTFTEAQRSRLSYNATSFGWSKGNSLLHLISMAQELAEQPDRVLATGTMFLGDLVGVSKHGGDDAWRLLGRNFFHVVDGALKEPEVGTAPVTSIDDVCTDLDIPGRATLTFALGNLEIPQRLIDNAILTGAEETGVGAYDFVEVFGKAA